MHGEMYQACSILVAARQALRTGAPFMYEAPQYESSTVFHFRSRSWLRGSKTYLVGNVSEWFGRCLTKGLSDVQYLTDTMPDNRDLLGFANASPNLLACFFRNGRVRLFGSCWLFDPQSRGWNVVYMEARKSGIFKRKLAWEDNTENFRQALVRIEAFARQIGCDDFAEISFGHRPFWTERLPEVPNRPLHCRSITGACSKPPEWRMFSEGWDRGMIRRRVSLRSRGRKSATISCRKNCCSKFGVPCFMPSMNGSASNVKVQNKRGS